jgi:hypothetical protein
LRVEDEFKYEKKIHQQKKNTKMLTTSILRIGKKEIVVCKKINIYYPSKYSKSIFQTTKNQRSNSSTCKCIGKT